MKLLNQNCFLCKNIADTDVVTPAAAALQTIVNASKQRGDRKHDIVCEFISSLIKYIGLILQMFITLRQNRLGTLISVTKVQKLLGQNNDKAVKKMVSRHQSPTIFAILNGKIESYGKF